MLAHFYAFQPDPRTGLPADIVGHVVEHVLGDRLAADRRQDSHRGEPVAFEPAEGAQVGIVLGNDQGVIELLVQPRADRLEAAEIEAPVALRFCAACAIMVAFSPRSR